MEGMKSSKIDLRHNHGPFDIIGDVHGCISELKQLLTEMDYCLKDTGDGNYTVEHPGGRRAIFLGDLVDRGPDIVAVLKLVMGMVNTGRALCVAGNHDMRILRKIREGTVLTSHGSPDWSMLQITEAPAGFREEVRGFLEGLPGHYVLDDGKLVVAHAGIREALQGQDSPETRAIAVCGEITGKTDEYGLPVRYDWAADYHGQATVVYGHTPYAQVQRLNNTINLDTGCVFGGKLTAFRYPEGDFVEVKALKMYCPPAKPFLPEHAGVSNVTAWPRPFLNDGVRRPDA